MEAVAKAGSLPFLRVLTGFLSFYIVTLATTMSGMEIAASVLVVLSLIGLSTGRLVSQRAPFLVPLAVFVLVAWVGTIYSGDHWSQVFYDIRRMRFFFLYVFLFLTLKHVPDFKWERVLAVVALFIAVYGTVQHFIPIDIFRPEGKKVILYAIAEQKIGPLVLGTFNHHLTFINIYLFYGALFLAFGLWGEEHRGRYLALGLWTLLLCLWTQSRTGWFAIGAVLAVLTFFKSRKLFVACMVGFTLLLAGLYSVDSGFRERFDRTFIKRDAQYSAKDRVHLWEANWEMFKTSPIIGIGYNNNERRAKEFLDRLYPNVQNFTGHAHSTLAQLLSTTGLIGIGAYLWLWVLIFRANLVWIRRATKGRERAIAFGLLAGFIGFHIQGLTQWNFGDAEVLHNLMFFWAVLAVGSSAAAGSAESAV